MWKKEEKIEIVDFQKEQRRRDRKQAIKNTLNGIAGFIRENQDVLLLTIPAAVEEIRFKERTIYDHSLGRYVELKKKLTAEQALTIEERRAAGEKLHVILDDMKLLKH